MLNRIVAYQEFVFGLLSKYKFNNPELELSVKTMHYFHGGEANYLQGKLFFDRFANFVKEKYSDAQDEDYVYEGGKFGFAWFMTPFYTGSPIVDYEFNYVMSTYNLLFPEKENNENEKQMVNKIIYCSVTLIEDDDTMDFLNASIQKVTGKSLNLRKPSANEDGFNINEFDEKNFDWDSLL